MLKNRAITPQLLLPAVIACLSLFCQSALAVPHEANAVQNLKHAQKLYKDAYFPEALNLCDQLLGRSDLNTSTRVEVYFLKGKILFLMQQKNVAEESFKHLFNLNAAFMPPAQTSPKVTAFLEDVRAAWKSTERQQLKIPTLLPPQIKIVNHTPRQQDKSQPLHFIFALEDPTQQTQTLQLFYRSDAQQKYAALAMQPGEESRWQLVLQPQGPTMHRVQYYAAALGAANQPLAFLGHPEQPFEIQNITAAATEPFYKRTWFWGTLLTGLSLAGLTHYMLITNKDEPPGDEVVHFP